MIFALALALSAQTTWQLAPGPGVAVSQSGTITASGGGVATLQLPNTNGSWRMTFDVRASKTAAGKQDIALLGNETLFRMHFENADAAYATLARGEKGLNVPVGETWRRVQIYDIRGCLSFRYEKKIMGAMNLSEAPTSFVVGVPKAEGAPAPGQVQIKDLAFSPVDDSLTGVAHDVPVPTLSSYKTDALIPRPFSSSDKPDVTVAANGTLVILADKVDLTCPSGANISLMPAAPAKPEFPIAGVGIAMDGQLLQETALKVGQSIPHFDYRLPEGNGGIHNFRYVIEDQAKNETAIQFVHIANDDFVAKHLQAQTDQNGCHITVSGIPATSLMLYARGVYLGSVMLENGQVTIPAALVPGGDAHWTAIAKDDIRLWGPLPFDISSHRTTFKGSVVRSDWDPMVSEATFTVLPSTSVQPPAKSMEVFADGALVQAGPVREINRTVLLGPGQDNATVRVQYTLADGSTVWGGTAMIMTPEDKNLSTVTAADSSSVVLVQILTDGWKSVETGFFFGSGRTIATASEVLQGQQVVRVVTTGGEVLPVVSIVTDPANGIAVLKLGQDSGHQPLLVSGMAPSRTAYVLQSKALPEGAMTHDNLVLPVQNFGTTEAGFSFPGQLIFNNVGAPVVDEKGQVLGIVIRTAVPGTTSRNVAINISAVTKLVASAQPEAELSSAGGQR